MSMYEMVFEDSDRPMRVALLVTLLGRPRVPRIRDGWVELHDDVPIIRLYTRLGGGNRPDYEDDIAVLRARPDFLWDADDNWESTYASFYFALPEGARVEMWREMAVAPVDMDAMWHAGIAKQKADLAAGIIRPEVQEVMNRLTEALKGDGPPDGIIRI